MSISYLLTRLTAMMGLVLALGLTAPNCLATEKVQSISVIPMTINAAKDLPHIRQGVSRMLYSRFNWPDRVQVTRPNTMENLVAESDGLSGDQLISWISEQTGSDFVVLGSITQLSDSFSIDAKVFDIKNKRYIAFFEQSDQPDALIEKVDRIAAMINKKVFDRETVTWNKIEKENQALIDQHKRRNPEYMLQQLPSWQHEKKEKVGWKIWKYIF